MFHLICFIIIILIISYKNGFKSIYLNVTGYHALIFKWDILYIIRLQLLGTTLAAKLVRNTNKENIIKTATLYDKQKPSSHVKTDNRSPLALIQQLRLI